MRSCGKGKGERGWKKERERREIEGERVQEGRERGEIEEGEIEIKKKRERGEKGERVAPARRRTSFPKEGEEEEGGR